MKKTRTLTFCFILFTIISCQKNKDSSNALITNFTLTGNSVKDRDELFEKKARYIPLETLPASLIGRINKIVKGQNCFFILSDDRRILVFDNIGNFISSLNRMGNGPGEYTMITDFNVAVNEKNETEIWLSDFKKIRKYKHADGFWKECGVIEYPYAVNKFHIVDNNRILLLTGQNNNSITLSDSIGNEMKSYLKSEIPFLLFKPVQFIDFQSELIFQKGVSNECVRFSISDNTFRNSKIVNENKFISSHELLDLFSKYQYDYLGKLPQYSHIRTLRKVKNQILIEFFMDGKRHISLFTNNKWNHLSYDPKSIIDDNEIATLATIGVGDSPNSFILFKYTDEEEKNPQIIEYEAEI